MSVQGYLNLRLIRLKFPEEWAPEVAGQYFLFPESGTGKYLSDPMTQRVASGDVMILNGECGGRICVSQEGELVFWVFSLTLDHLFPLFAASEILLLQNVLECLKGLKLYPASNPVAQECHRLVGEVPPQSNLDHRSQLLRIAAILLTEEFKTTQRYRVGFIRIEEHLLQVFEKLSADELLSLSVGDLASRFGCSRRHLNRLFNQFFGFSVAALKMEMRLLKAVSLLRDPDAKVINVADYCGFNHLGLFNTCFKRRFGVSPGQWRKQSEQDPAERSGFADHDSNGPLRTNARRPSAGRGQELFSASPISVLLRKAIPQGPMALAGEQWRGHGPRHPFPSDPDSSRSIGNQSVPPD